VSGTITINSNDLLNAVKPQLLQMPEITQQPYSYIIYKDGTNYYAKNGSTGQIDFSGTDANTVVNNVLNSLSSGSILFKGDFSSLTLQISNKGRISIVFDKIGRIVVDNCHEGIELHGNVVNNGVLINDSHMVKINVISISGNATTPAIELRGTNNYCGWNHISVITVNTSNYNGPAQGIGILLNPTNPNYTIEGNVIEVKGTIYGADTGVYIKKNSHWNRIFVDVDNAPAGGSNSVVVEDGAMFNTIYLYGLSGNPPKVAGRSNMIITLAEYIPVPDTWLDSFQTNYDNIVIENPVFYARVFTYAPGQRKGVHIDTDGFINLFKNPNIPGGAQLIFSNDYFTRMSNYVELIYDPKTDILFTYGTGIVRINNMRLDATTQTVDASSTYTIPAGFYYVILGTTTKLEIFNGATGAWVEIIPAGSKGVIASDGKNARLSNTGTTSDTSTLIRIL